MFLLAQEKSDTIEFLKSELVQLLSNMRQEIAASRQSQTGAACHHIEYCMDKIQRAKSSVAIALPIESLNLEITTMLRQQLIVLPPEARKNWDQIKKLDFKYCHLKQRVGQKSVIRQNSISSSHLLNHCVLLDNPKIIERLGLLSQPLFCIT